MSDYYNAPVEDDHDVRPRAALLVLLDTILGKRLEFVTVFVFCMVLGLLSLVFNKPIFESYFLVYPSAGESTGGGGGVSSLLGLGGRAPNKFDQFLSLLKTPGFAANLEARYRFAEKLYPALWDAEHKTWRAPRGLSALLERAVGWKAYPADPVMLLTDHLNSGLKISPLDEKTRLTRVSYSSLDRAQATQFLQAVVVEADDVLRRAERVRLQKRLKYIDDELSINNSLEHKTELLGLLNEVERDRMSLESAPYFGADFLQPVFTPKNPSHTSIKLVLIFSVLGSFMLSLVVVIILSVWPLPGSILKGFVGGLKGMVVRRRL